MAHVSTSAPFDLNDDGQVRRRRLDHGHRARRHYDLRPVSGAASDDGMGILQSPGVVEWRARNANPVQYKYSPGSSGSIQRITENPGAGATGRQSWRQIRMRRTHNDTKTAAGGVTLMELMIGRGDHRHSGGDRLPELSRSR